MAMFVVKSFRIQINGQVMDLSVTMYFFFYQMQMLSHANLAKFIGAVIEPGHMFLMMEYCPRGSLQVYYGWCAKHTLMNIAFALFALLQRRFVELALWNRFNTLNKNLNFHGFLECEKMLKCNFITKHTSMCFFYIKASFLGSYCTCSL